MAKVKVAFKNILDKRAVYKTVESDFLTLAVGTYARLYCEDSEIHNALMHEKVIIALNGKRISVDDWSITPLRDDDKIMVRPIIEGDSGGGGLMSMVLGAVLLIASVLLAPYTGGASFMLWGMTVNTTIFLMGAAMILGGLMQMLMAPDLPTLSAGGLDSGGSSTYSWSGIKTQARPDAAVPVVYGKHLTGGNLINIFTERHGTDDYLYMLLALAEGEIEGICVEGDTDSVCTTTNFADAAYKHPHILLSDQPLKNYSDVEWWYRKGTNLPDAAVEQTDPSAQNIVPNFFGSRMQMDDGRELTKAGIVYTTSKEIDMAVVQVRFPGMFNSAAGDGLKDGTVNYKIEFKKNGTGTWYDYTQTKLTPKLTPQAIWYGTSPARTWGDDLQYSDSVSGGQGGNTFALTETPPDNISFEVTNTTTVIKEGPVGYNPSLPIEETKTVELTVENEATGEIWLENITYVTPITWPYYATYPAGERGTTVQSVLRLTLGSYVVTVPPNMMQGESYLLENNSEDLVWRTITNLSKTGFWSTSILNFHTQANSDGKQIYDLRISRADELSASFDVANNAVLSSVIEILNGDFIYPNTALLGFKIKATGQLSGSPPNINVMLKGLKVDSPDHSGAETFEELFWDETQARWEHSGDERTWDNVTYKKEYSNNSMLCLKDLLTNKRYGLGEYTNTGDFSDANTISIIKECHKYYLPTENDYLSWWDAGNPTEFAKNVYASITPSWPKTLTIDSTAETVAYADAYAHRVPLILDGPLKETAEYQFSITLSGTTSNVDIDLMGSQTVHGDFTGTWTRLASKVRDKGDGTHTLNFTTPVSGITGLIIILSSSDILQHSGTIDDISVNVIAGTGKRRAWHYHTYNGVLESRQSALSTLIEFTNSFRVWPSWYEGTFKFIMDKDETPIHTIAISNTTSFSQSWTPLSEMPYRLIGQFTDEDRAYELTQIMKQSTDNNLPKSNEQTIGLKGVTNRKRAEREITFRLTKFSNSTHTINIKCGMDMIHATAGDVINVSNDLPAWGHGTRVASYNAGNKYIYLTEEYTIVDATPLDVMIKYQDINNGFQTASLDVSGISDGDTVRRVTTKSWPENPNINGPAVLGPSTSYVKKFRLLSVTRSGEEEVEAQGLEHIDTIYSSEPTLVINQDYETETIKKLVAKPGIPINTRAVQLIANEGIGWDLAADHADIRSQEIQVLFSSDTSNYTYIGSIAQGQTSMRYVNNTLETGKEYYFKFVAKGLTGNSDSAYLTAYLSKLSYEVGPPTGLLIKSADPLSQTWDGKNVTVQWNPVGQNLYTSGMFDFYTVRVYHTEYIPTEPQTNLSRIAYTKKTEYQYTYDMNLEDNGLTTPKGTLIYVLTANLVNGVESDTSRPFLITNAAPSKPSNFTSETWLRTVTFKWSPDSGTDFKHYKLRHRIESSVGAAVGAYGAWEERTDNFFARTITGTEINTFGEKTQVFLEVKAIDLYNSSSLVASGNGLTQTLNIQTVDVATAAITAPTIATFAVTTPKVATFAITTPKIGDGAVASIKVADAAIEEAKIGALAVTEAKIQNLAVSTGKIASLAVDTAQIASLAVTDAKILSLDASKITTGYLAAARIEAGTITATHIAANSITAAEIRGADFGELTFSSGKIIMNADSGLEINTASAMVVKTGGDIRVEDGGHFLVKGGGDIKLVDGGGGVGWDFAEIQQIQASNPAKYWRTYKHVIGDTLFLACPTASLAADGPYIEMGGDGQGDCELINLRAKSGIYSAVDGLPNFCVFKTNTQEKTGDFKIWPNNDTDNAEIAFVGSNIDKYVIGLDYGDDLKFKINAAAGFSDPADFEMDLNGNIEIANNIGLGAVAAFRSITGGIEITDSAVNAVPGLRIDVGGRISAHGAIEFEADRGSAAELIGDISWHNNNAATAVGIQAFRGSTDAKGVISFITSSEERFKIDEDGKAWLYSGALEIDNPDASDSVIIFDANNDDKFTMGIDSSNGYRFKIRAGGVLDDPSEFELDSSGNVEIAGNILTKGGNIQIDIASGDPIIIFDTQGADKFTIGVDDSDSDKFKINSGGSLADPSDFEIDSSGNVEIAGNILTLGGTIEIDVASGDPIIIFDTQGADKWAIGVDDSDSDKFKINSGGSLADPSDFEIDSSGNVVIGAALNVSAGVLTVQGAAAVSQITMKDSDGNIDGYVYATGGLVGFLDSGGSWAYKITNDASHEWMVAAAVKMSLDSAGDLAVVGDITAVDITASGGIEIDVATGDPMIIFDTQGGDKWAMGVDDDDSDNFKINSGNMLTDPSDFEISAAGNVEIGGGLQLKAGNLIIRSNGPGSMITMKDSLGNIDGYVYALAGMIGFFDDDGQWAYKITTDTSHEWSVNNAVKMTLDSSGYLTAVRTYNPVYADFSDYQELEDELSFGICYYRDKNVAKKCVERCQKGVIGVASDTYGSAVGKDPKKTQVPIAVAGFILAYVDKEYESGTALVNDEYGFLTEASQNEKRLYPERILGIYMNKEEQDFWNDIEVNKRHWVKVT